MVRLDPAYDDAPVVLPRLQALRSGDWGPAARLLEETGRDWDRRAHRVNRLAQGLGECEAIAAWVAAEPDSPDAWLLHTRALVWQAWRIRGSARAARVPKRAWAGFFEHLHAADAALDRAIELAPDDPTPWGIAVLLARGLQMSRRRFDLRWSELVRRDPSHVYGHYCALQYVCAKWSGSHEEMYSFADRVSDTAPPGSPLHLLPVFAVTEHALALRSGDKTAGSYRDFKDRAARAVEQAVERWETPFTKAGAAPHARVVFDRAHLANLAWGAGSSYFSGAREVAVRQYRAMGPYCSKEPWSYFRSAPHIHRLLCVGRP
jgi:Domain of unknown function (DUF4034)